MRSVQSEIYVSTSPLLTLEAFTDIKHLSNWWQVNKTCIDLKEGGLYTLAWQEDDYSLTFVSTGVISKYVPGESLSIANMVYINPEISILGPMQLDINVRQEADDTIIRVSQSGYGEGVDWDWYYEAVQQGWPMALQQLKNYLATFDE